MRKLLASLGLCILAGCAAKPPYEDLNRQSYGPLINYRDSQTHESTTPPLCNPDPSARDPLMAELGRNVIGGLFKPVGGMTKIDPKILNEELQDNFRTPGDFLMPPVVLLQANADNVVFWYVADIVSFPEVAKAAAAHCGKRHRQVLYEGTARRCAPPQKLPVLIKGASNIEIDTYAISSFQCVGPNSSKANSSAPGRPQ